MTGILLVNLGTPDAPTRPAVYRYLKQFLLDPRVIDIHPIARNLLVRCIIAPFRSGKSAEAYRHLWTENGSPLKYYGENLAAQVQNLLGPEYAVELAMRYQNPSIESAVAKLMQAKVSKIKVFTLFPQYASATTGSVHEAVMRVLSRQQVIPAVEMVSAYPTWEPMIDLFVKNAMQFDLLSYDHFLFSYHGLPQRQLRKADAFNHCLQKSDCCQTLTPTNRFCYSAQCYATTQAIAGRLQLKPGQYTVCFQSRLGRDPWTQPYTVQVIENLAKSGAKRLLVFCPAFTADCLETTIEIGEEYREDFLKWGGERLDLVESLNDKPAWAAAVADYLRN
ncbi:MAG: ferrochelatase [Haliscomenobacteraceae bacterium CHB4]|nr:Ferrochelatase [Saprospiraceae bacterium]MCE7922064.1 ferrochelatase [Haliscomenobacteraceae bacterium CHB4]